LGSHNAAVEGGTFCRVRNNMKARDLHPDLK